MSFLGVLLDPILPVFAILALGYGFGKAGVTGQDAARAINRFAMTVLIPIVLFDLLAHAPFGTFTLVPILLYAVAQSAVFTAGYLVARRIFRRGAGEAVILAYAGIFANNVFFGLPVARLIYGDAGLLPVTMVVVLDSVFAFGGTMVALQAIEQGRVSLRRILGIFARTPALLAIIVGLVWGVAGLPIPLPFGTFLDFNGQAAAPVALFALGVVMSATALRPDAAVLIFTAIKAFLLPAAVWLALRGGGQTEPALSLFTLAAAAPAGAMSMSLAVLHDLPTRTVAQVMVLTSLLALFTMAAIA